MSFTPDYGSGESPKEDVQEEQGDGDAHPEQSEVSEHPRKDDRTPAVPGPLVPDRVKRALGGAKDFARKEILQVPSSVFRAEGHPG